MIGSKSNFLSGSCSSPAPGSPLFPPQCPHKEFLKSSYYVSQSELMVLFSTLGIEDVYLYQGKADKELVMKWFSFGTPRAAVFYKSTHFVPVLNLNVIWW